MGDTNGSVLKCGIDPRKGQPENSWKAGPFAQLQTPCDSVVSRHSYYRETFFAEVPVPAPALGASGTLAPDVRSWLPPGIHKH